MLHISLTLNKPEGKSSSLSVGTADGRTLTDYERALKNEEWEYIVRAVNAYHQHIDFLKYCIAFKPTGEEIEKIATVLLEDSDYVFGMDDFDKASQPKRTLLKV